ncbi:hypothetical protein U729_3168 (plasmid) [Clostridium baratii str. Sullivan]|uniref:DUF7694 domain-containing protein n=1 Tax=Clostridium baratii str. Sullivan TaxID=1415775 RepID=A0A0A7G038_9CLOT|nr:hypothetical protein [Clostridium baratii]AIY85207.1 hypothetical protein U729_3168 [Clostridium baratii str. Sullivan]
MKNLNYLNNYRVKLFGEIGDEYNGAFFLLIDDIETFVIAAKTDEWEHVSVSHKNVTPSWDTMCKIKDMFFEDNETVMQLHPPKEDYINIHEHCLHMWRPVKDKIKMPPDFMV